MTPFERAERAKQLLADPVLSGAFADIRSRLIAQLESAPISDVELQHEVTLMLQLLKRVREQLERYVGDGAMEQHRAKQATYLERIRERLS